MNDVPVEARVTVLGGDVHAMRMLLERIDERIKTLATREDVAELKGRVSRLPTTMTLIGFVLAVLAAGGVMKHFFP